MAQQSAWESGRPIYHRLPIESEQYQGNDVVDWLTTPFDRILMEVKAAIENIEQDLLDPTTCRTDVLDWLAQHHGFTGDYWESRWPEDVKRQLIQDAETFIWPNLGRAELLQYMLDTFEIRGKYYQLGMWIAGISKAGDVIGGEPMTFYVLMPLSSTGYLYTSYEWQLAEKLVRLYMPCWARSRVQYNAWYAGFSRAGDTFFDLALSPDLG